MPAAAETLVINTGPIVALGRVGALDFIGCLGISFVAPQQVADELAIGVRLGRPVEIPAWVKVETLRVPSVR